MAAVTNAKIIAALRDTRGMVTVAARKLGISRQQIYRRIESSEDVREALEESRDFTTDTAELALYKAIQDGEAWAVCFYLKTQGKERGYVEKQQIEHSGHVDLAKLSDDELRAIAEG
jgi:hypothetical protein